MFSEARKYQTVSCCKSDVIVPFSLLWPEITVIDFYFFFLHEGV